MNYAEFKNLSKAQGEAAKNFREMIEEAKLNSVSKFFPQQFEYLLKHLQDSSQRQVLLNQINDPKTTVKPDKDCETFKEIFEFDRADLSEFRSKQAEKLHDVVNHRRSHSTSLKLNKLPENVYEKNKIDSNTLFDTNDTLDKMNVGAPNSSDSGIQEQTQKTNSLRFGSQQRKQLNQSMACNNHLRNYENGIHINSLIKDAHKRGKSLANEIWQQHILTPSSNSKFHLSLSNNCFFSKEWVCKFKNQNGQPESQTI